MVCIIFFLIRLKTIFSLDINECLSSPCAKTMKCENTPGSYHCVEGCELGYTWSLKQGECRDIDECALHKHNCTHGHRCENMPGSFRCIRERNCGTGYQVDPITQTCIGKTEKKRIFVYIN